MIMRDRLGKVLLVGFIIAAGLLVSFAFHGQCFAKEYQIVLHGAAQGTSGHVITFAWGDLINKHSTWLKTKVSQELAPGSTVPLFVMRPEIRKTDIMFTVVSQPQGWDKGLPPLPPKKNYTSWRMICKTITAPGIVLTLDPNIKTIHDLEGKKLANLPRMSPVGVVMLNLLYHGAGLKGKVNVQTLAPPGSKDALLSGLVDAVLFPFNLTSSSHTLKGFEPMTNIRLSSSQLDQQTENSDRIEYIVPTRQRYFNISISLAIENQVHIGFPSGLSKMTCLQLAAFRKTIRNTFRPHGG